MTEEGAQAGARESVPLEIVSPGLCGNPLLLFAFLELAQVDDVRLLAYYAIEVFVQAIEQARHELRSEQDRSSARRASERTDGTSCRAGSGHTS